MSTPPAGRIWGMLDTLRGRLEPALAGRSQPDCVVQIWDGAWDALEGPQRASLPPVAGLVAMTRLRVVSLGRLGEALGRRADPWTMPYFTPGADPTPGAADPTPVQPVRPTVEVEVAFAVLVAGRDVDERTRTALALIEAALPICIDAGLQQLNAANLYAEALARKGLASLAILGRRLLELEPSPPGPPELAPGTAPRRIRSAGLGGAPERIEDVDVNAA